MEAAEEVAERHTMIGHVPMRDLEEAIEVAITEETTGMKEIIIALIEEEITKTEEMAVRESTEEKADVTSTDLILKTLKSPPHLSEIEEIEIRGALTTAHQPNPTRKKKSRKKTPLKSKNHLRKPKSLKKPKSLIKLKSQTKPKSQTRPKRLKRPKRPKRLRSPIK